MKLIIDEVIKSKGMLKKDVAKELGVDPNTLSRYMNGSIKITLETADKIAEILDCKVDDLYKREGNPEPKPGG